MNKSQLVEKLQNMYDNKSDLVAEIYFILKKENEEIKLKFADLDEIAQIELTEQFIDKAYNDLVINNELQVMDLSSADERKNVIYKYDLEDVPEELKVIEEVRNNEDIADFSFKEDNLADIKGFVVLIKNDNSELVLYKKHYPIHLYKKDKGLSLKKMGNQRFTTLSDDVLKIIPSFEFFNISGSLFINNLNALERFFGFHDLIKKRAASCLDQIETVGLLEDPSELKEMLDDISFARKLSKVNQHSPVLGIVPNNVIISFVQTYPTLKDKLKVNDSGEKIVVSTKNSKRLFLQLLNDDFLQSQLTQAYYSSLAKDKVDA